MKKTIILLNLLFMIACNDPVTSVPDNTNSISIHVTLGLPTDSDSSDDYVIIRHKYVLSYNKNKNVANWVACELNTDWFDYATRFEGGFITDTSLPKEWPRFTTGDYTNSRFDRGHMVMSEERTASFEDNKSTFILTNIMAQTPDLNQGIWLKFEKFCNDLAEKKNKELFIYAGETFYKNQCFKGKFRIPDSVLRLWLFSSVDRM